MSPIAVLFVVLLLCCLLVLHYKRRRRYLELATQVPTFKDCLPVVGHIHKLIGGRERFWENVKEVINDAEKVGGVITLWAGPKAIFWQIYKFKDIDLHLADPSYNIPGPIDLLIGVKEYAQIIEDDIIRGPPGTPCAQKTTLGWILFGEIDASTNESSFMVMHHQVDVDDLLKSIWEVDTEEKRMLTKEEQACETIYENTYTRNEEGRYIVKLPLKTEVPRACEGNTREIAQNRLLQLEKKFMRMPHLNIHKLIGGRERFWENVKEVINDAEKVGGVITLWAGPKAIFCINDPDDALTVVNSCLEKNQFYKLGSSWLGDGLLIANVPTWKRNRKLLNPTFSQHVLDGFLDVFNRQAGLMVQDLEPKAGAGQFDPTEFFIKRTLETVCQTVVGISLDDRSVIDSKYQKSVEVALNLIAHRLACFWLLPDFIFKFTSLRRTMDEAVATLQNMSRTVLYKRKAERQQCKIANTTSRRFIAFLDLLLDLAEDGSFTDQQIQEELDTLIAAGHDTSSRALVSTLVLVGTHQDVQEKVYQEIMAVLGSSADLDKEDMTKLVYTEAVVKEVLRISPVVPFIGREVKRDIKLKNFTIPAGSGCGVAFWGIHRLPIWGPDCLEFRPERWLDPATLPQSPGAYCAFSIGRRNCIGKTYALMVMKTMLVHLVRKYRISADHSKVKLKFEVLLKYTAGQHISLELRE